MRQKGIDDVRDPVRARAGGARNPGARRKPEAGKPPLISVRDSKRVWIELLAGDNSFDRNFRAGVLHYAKNHGFQRIEISDEYVFGSFSVNASRALGVSDVVAATGASRRLLEKRFKSLTGRTILDTIHEKRLAGVRDLLRNTDAPMGVIAARADFTSLAGLSALFKRQYGESMRDFRAELKKMR